MNRIDDLIAHHGPDGVHHEILGDIATVVSGLSGKSKADFSGGNARYVSYKNAYANIEVDQSAAELVAIGTTERQNRLRIGDIIFTGSSESAFDVGMSSVVTAEPKEPLYLNSFCFAVRLRDQGALIPNFAKYLFRSKGIREQIQRTASGVTRINISKSRFLRIKIPIPHLEVQREIAQILDNFTELEVQLEAELEARRRQYAYYRDSLLAFTNRAKFRWAPMGELGEFIRGRRFVKNDYVPGGIPSIHYGEIYTTYGVSARTSLSAVRRDLAPRLRFAQMNDVVIAGVGETVADVGKSVAWLGDYPVAIHDDCFAFRSAEDPRYIAYVMQTPSFQLQKNLFVASAKVKRLSGSSMAKIFIPVPPIEEQQRIVAILDSFDALVNDLSIGLPAELGARRKQYEYYRDRLLTFKEAVA